MLRALAKTSIACAYSLSGLQREDRAQMPFIVGYHRVVENFHESAKKTIPSMLVAAKTFEQHVDWLARRFDLLSLDEIGAHLESGRRFRRPAAAITFDDGYADVYHNAFPILRRKGIPAAAFVVTGLLGTRRPQVYDRLYLHLSRTTPDPFEHMTKLLMQHPQETLTTMLDQFEADHPPTTQDLEALAPMTWEMIAEMDRNGMSIGSHTNSHVLLTSESIERARRELTESRETLERALNRKVLHFAYPDGRCNPAIVEAVKGAGYKYGYTICQWRDSNQPLLTIPRKVLWERASANAWGQFSASIMNCHANWFFDRNGSCEHDHGAQAA